MAVAEIEPAIKVQKRKENGKTIFFATTHTNPDDAEVLYDAMLLGVDQWREQIARGEKPSLVEIYVAPEE